ncbi:hypothetical protein AgCh_005054 [Apium graveolens]
MVTGLENAKVSSLLNLEGNVWDADLLRDVFYNEDVERILKIPISSSHREDKWMWSEDNKCIYTVKSGYRVLRQSLPEMNSQGSFKWLCFWRLSIPPKLKNFIWRVLHDCIPTLENLRRKYVDVYPLSFLEMGKKCSYGFVLRDDQGDFIAGGGGRVLGALDPRTAEPLAFRDALSWLKNKGCQNVYMELDCLSVVEAIRYKEAQPNLPPPLPANQPINNNMSRYEAIKVPILKIHKYPIWKVKMAIFLEATDLEYLSRIYDGPHRPMKVVVAGEEEEII